MDGFRSTQQAGAVNSTCKPYSDVPIRSYNNQFLFFVNFDIPLGNPAEPRAGIFPFQYFANMIYFSQNWAISPFMRRILIKN